eukprot:TRINITY_DN145_c0_g1_i1.p1 TRINITY_DN145_c0_g1~~TRINITY_DN145_c0_g1_i1.p1  ORF type:complete len:428 (+),score=58.90 TRINITY_DN145_c0_g1_i1:91-1374(+)
MMAAMASCSDTQSLSTVSSPRGLEYSSFENCEEVTSDSCPNPAWLDLSTLENSEDNEDVAADIPSTPTESERNFYLATAPWFGNGDAHPQPCVLPAMQVQEATCAMQQKQFHFPVAPPMPHTKTPPFCVQSPSSSVVHQAPDTQSLSTVSSPRGFEYSSFENCEEVTSDSCPNPAWLDLSTLENSEDNEDVAADIPSTPTESERNFYLATAPWFGNGDAHPQPCVLPAMQVQEATCAMQQKQFHFPVAPPMPHTTAPPSCVQLPLSSVVHQGPAFSRQPWPGCEPKSYVSSDTQRKKFRARQKRVAPAAGMAPKTPPPQQTVANNKSKSSSAFEKRVDSKATIYVDGEVMGRRQRMIEEVKTSKRFRYSQWMEKWHQVGRAEDDPQTPRVVKGAMSKSDFQAKYSAWRARLQHGKIWGCGQERESQQ